MLTLVVGAGLPACGAGSTAHSKSGAARTGSDPGDHATTVMRCSAENQISPVKPGARDLVDGPLIIPNGRVLGRDNPREFGAHGRYKVPFVFAPGAVATVTIGQPARRYTVITTSQDTAAGSHAATSVVYHACPHWGFFAQYIKFTDGRTRGCVPLDVQIAARSRARRMMLDLFTRSCMTR